MLERRKASLFQMAQPKCVSLPMISVLTDYSARKYRIFLIVDNTASSTR